MNDSELYEFFQEDKIWTCAPEYPNSELTMDEDVSMISEEDE